MGRTLAFDWASGFFTPFLTTHAHAARELDDMRRAWTEVAAVQNRYTRMAEGFLACQIEAQAGDEFAVVLMTKYQAERDALLAQRVANRLTGGKK